MQNHLSKPQDVMLQNATPRRKSPPSPPNSSDEDVSCTAPATENASLQIIFACPHACHRFWTCYKNLTFCSLLTRCTIPCACHAKTRSERPKVVRTWCDLYILTWKCASRHNGVHFFDFSTSKSAPNVRCFFTCKCASRHNGVHFFDFSTSKSAPNVSVLCTFRLAKCASRHNGVHFFRHLNFQSGQKLVCFVHFDFEMCFAPQRRALFHRSSGQMAPHPPL